MPIIDATWAVKSGVWTTCDQSVTAPRAVMIPRIAVTIGRPMATTEPKATSRMNIAARRPNSSLAGGPSLLNPSPRNSTWTPPCCSALARSSNAPVGSSEPPIMSWSMSTRMKAVVPSADTWFCWPNGEVADSTPTMDLVCST